MEAMRFEYFVVNIKLNIAFSAYKFLALFASMGIFDEDGPNFLSYRNDPVVKSNLLSMPITVG